MTAASLELRPITRRIGAEILGIDLSRRLTMQEIELIHEALMNHQVVFFRDQQLDHHGLKAFAREFGELQSLGEFESVPGHPELWPVHHDSRSKFVAGARWHSDMSCKTEPPKASILYLTVVPEVGGDTMFSSMYDAYDALSKPMKAYLEGLTAVHDGDQVLRPLYKPTDGRVYPITAHPIVRTHPVTGRKLLYVNPHFTTHIVEVSRPESDAVLAYLHQHCASPNFHMRFRWRPRSVAFWDNRCTQHMAIADYFPETRSGFRVQIVGRSPHFARDVGYVVPQAA